MTKKRRRTATRRKPEPKPPLDLLSLMIAAVALTVLVLFFFPWLQSEEEPLSGLDVASRNLEVTKDFPSGIVFILPLVVVSMLFQYYRRVRDTVRPRRRFATISMLVVGLIATLLWVRNYTLNATDRLNEQAAAAQFGDLPDDPRFETDTVSSEPETYSTGDVLRDQFTFELWLHLALSMSLLVLPYLDTREPDEPPEI